MVLEKAYDCMEKLVMLTIRKSRRRSLRYKKGGGKAVTKALSQPCIIKL